MNATQVSKALQKLENPKRAIALAKDRQAFPGGYGDNGSHFYGLTVPEIRSIAESFRNLPFAETKKLFRSLVHEERICATMIWCEQLRKANRAGKKKIYSAYLAGRRFMNNWDLIDGSAPTIVGGYLLENRKDRPTLYKLARSRSLWDRRIAMVSTQHFIRHGEFQDTLKLAKLLLKDEHDLIHKASGWMLREMGKKDERPLHDFLNRHAIVMPRTMLRYSIERFPKKIRDDYMGRRKKAGSDSC